MTILVGLGVLAPFGIWFGVRHLAIANGFMSNPSEPDSDASWERAARRATALETQGQTADADREFEALVDRLVAASQLPASQPGYVEPESPMDWVGTDRSARNRCIRAIQELAYDIPNRRPDLEAELWQALHDRGSDGEKYVGPMLPANNAGATWEHAGELGRADHVLSEGIARARHVPGQPPGILERLLIHHGSVLTKLGRLDEARATLNEANDLNAVSSDTRNRADIDIRLQSLAEAEATAGP